MKGLLAALLVGVLASTLALGTPIPTAHHNILPAREYSQRLDQQHLRYYNYCSGWLRSWFQYCGAEFGYPNPAVYGTCFDLGDIPGDCRTLETVWYACYAFDFWGELDIEIYCANQDECPVGSPLGGVYGFTPPYGSYWHIFDFGGLPLCACEGAGTGKFVVLITDYTAGYESVPYSDLNHTNLEAGCENEWRCGGHSYIFGNWVLYCDVYGAPAPLWVHGPEFGCVNYPTVPPGCHTSTGYYCEWLIDCYISCQGPTQTERQSWSEVKALYR